MKIASILAISVLVASLIGISSDNAFAQSYSSVLVFDPILSSVVVGDTIIFSGQLLTTEGYVISDAIIYLKDDVKFGSDYILGEIETDDNGEFYAEWIATQREDLGSYDFFVEYEGADGISSSRSVTYSVAVGEFYPTSIVFDKIPSSAYAGDSITFTGKLYADGTPFPNALVRIYEDDPFSLDEVLAEGFTDSNGNFNIPWNIDAALFEIDFDIHASFGGNSVYASDESPNQTISIQKHSGDIQLDPIPVSAKIGEPITFSGNLSLNTGSPEGAIVYIKDEDSFGRDDLLATAWVDANGRFSATWYASDVDEDNEADIYAVFEGNDIYYRLTTCDANPTRSFGGLCSITNPLYISGTYLPPSSPPSDYSGEYMEGFYSLNFAQRPLIAIVPTPDAYSEAAKHIGSVKEGVLMWELYLDNSYGGNWDVDFDVVSSNAVFFSDLGMPDVIVNLITPEMDSKCDSDSLGWTWISRSPVKPIQAYVCISSNGQSYSTQSITETSAHEFIHAMGLGHAWNKKGDLMCSGEEVNGKFVYTCPSLLFGSYDTTPSALNLDGVVQIYGEDGFLNPNNYVPYKTKFILESNYDQANVLQNDQPSIQLSENNVVSNEKATTVVTTDNSIPTIQPKPNVNLDETFEEIYNENKNTECGYGSTLVNDYCVLDQLADEIVKAKDISDLIKLELYADGGSVGNYIARDEGKPIQFVGKLINDSGKPVKSSIVNIVDKQTGVIQSSGVTKGSGDFIVFWKTDTSRDNFVDGKSKWEFVATSKVGSKTVTSSSVIVVVTDPTFTAEKTQSIVESLEPEKNIILESNEVIEEKIEASEPVKQVEEKPEKEMTCFLFWCW